MLGSVMTTKTGATAMMLLVLGSSGWAWADDAERVAMVGIRMTTEPAAVRGCTGIGRVSDDSVKDLRRKIVRVGGNAALLSFGVEELSTIYADVFRCPPPAPASPASSVPPGVPRPPAGAPPPPPPGTR
jgi:hypothetical protein